MFTDWTSRDASRWNSEVAVMAVGSFEQHGGHLPLVTDTVVAEVIAQRLAERYGLFRLPPVTMSCSHEHEGYPGTVSLSASTLIAIIRDVRASLAEVHTNTCLVLVNGHGGNYVLSNIAQEANLIGPSVALFPGRQDVDVAREAAGMESTASEDMHAGEWETSILLHAYPELVRPSYKEADYEAPERPYFHLTGMAGYSKTGVIGYPSKATAEKGARALDSLTASFRGLFDLLVAD
ncbi:creatininase family protein [Actinokineospora diospyrosa]|nr:creatininase family protein [Actinokineospora diospyrosa]